MKERRGEEERNKLKASETWRDRPDDGNEPFSLSFTLSHIHIHTNYVEKGEK